MASSSLSPTTRAALLAALRQKHSKAGSLLAKGFTLVELMIVIVIVGILAAVALPNFIGAKSKAEAGSLIGTMSGYAKECASNAVIKSEEELTGLPTTVTLTDGTNAAGVAGTECEFGGTLANSDPFPQPKKIGGLICGVDAVGEPQRANGVDDETCTLTIDENGGITGAWS